MTEGRLRVCPVCRTYTLRGVCASGHGTTRSPHPPRFSPHDRYGEYRRRLYDEAARSTSASRSEE